MKVKFQVFQNSVDVDNFDTMTVYDTFLACLTSQLCIDFANERSNAKTPRVPPKVFGEAR
jgi:hypothetical protein